MPISEFLGAQAKCFLATLLLAYMLIFILTLAVLISTMGEQYGSMEADKRSILHKDINDLMMSLKQAQDSRQKDNRNSEIGFESLITEIVGLENELDQFKSLFNFEYKINAATTRRYPPVKFRGYRSRKKILVTGGTGFVGSHLVDKLMLEGHEVVALDNHFTGRRRNIAHWIGHANFELVHHDIINPYFMEADQVYHLASPASPPHYMYNPVKTIKTNAVGTINMLGLARRVKATILLASTSEVDSEKWLWEWCMEIRKCIPNQNHTGEVSIQLDLDRVMMKENVDIRIARIFNTFGPRMHMNDGRVVYGKGDQTRSFQYIDDLVDGLIALMNSNVTVPVNLGNPEEHTIEQFAAIIRDLVGSDSEIVNKDEQTDDPKQRRPDISRAKELLAWKPKVPMIEGLKKTINFFRNELDNEKKQVDEETLHYQILEKKTKLRQKSSETDL